MSCDIFVSLHRSEGLGLVPLEAMRLGKAVVATGWSGNMSYMNNLNACLVGFDLVPTDHTSDYYGSRNLGIKAYWAEPDLDHAARWLLKLAEDVGLRFSIGRRAFQDANYYQKSAQDLDFMNEIQFILANRDCSYSKDRQAIIKQVRLLYQREKFRRMSTFLRLVASTHWLLKNALNRMFLWRFRHKG